MPKVFLLLGSNLGQRKRNLQIAERQIQHQVGEVIETSAIYKTAPWGKEDQKDFYNRVVLIKTRKYPQTILRSILEIEQEMGRVRKEKWGERKIDIDILFYGSKIIGEENLQIPHPRFEERNFAIIPMMELAANFKHPKLNLSIEEIYERSTDTCEVYLLNE